MFQNSDGQVLKSLKQTEKIRKHGNVRLENENNIVGLCPKLTSFSTTRKVLTNAELLDIMEKKKKEGLDEFKKSLFSEENSIKSDKVKALSPP